jgi:DNA mismatch repair protein MSH2
LNIREIVVPSGSVAQECYARLRSAASGLGIVCTSARPSDFSEEAGKDDLLKLCRSQSDCHAVICKEWYLAQRCLAALSNYMNLLGNDQALHSYNLTCHQLSQYVRLDETALRALDLFPRRTAEFNVKRSKAVVDSLFALLNRCRTVQGARLLGQWIRQPLRNQEMIEKRLDVIEALHTDHNLVKDLSDSLKGCSDLSRCGRRLWLGRSRLQDIITHHSVIIKAQGLDKLMHSDIPVILKTIKEPLQSVLNELQPFRHMVEESVDMDALSRHEYCMRADFDTDLQAIASQRSSIQSAMDVEHQRVAGLCGLERFKKLKLDRSPVYGHHFRVSRLVPLLLQLPLTNLGCWGDH